MGWLLFTDHELHVLTNTENDFFRERERERNRERGFNVGTNC